MIPSLVFQGTPNEFAHAAEIRLKATQALIGGGTIITPTRVITAASLLDSHTNPTKLKVHVGVRTYNALSYNVIQKIVHPSYTGFITHDIAILTTTTITFNENVGVACLLHNFEALTPTPFTGGVVQVNAIGKNEIGEEFSGTSDECTNGGNLCTFRTEIDGCNVRI